MWLVAIVATSWSLIAPSATVGRRTSRLWWTTDEERKEEEFKEFVQYNRGNWVGEARSVVFDPNLRLGKNEAAVDGKRYLSIVTADKENFEERCLWDIGDVVEDARKGKDLCCHRDGSYSLDHAEHSLANQTSPFAAEISCAISNNARVRVVVGYDDQGRLERVTALDEVRSKEIEDIPLTNRVSSIDLEDLTGEWRGDASVRSLAYDTIMVAKQDIFYEYLEAGFNRNLRMVGYPDSEPLEGRIAPTLRNNQRFQLVGFNDGTAMLVFNDKGVYVFVPWTLNDKSATLIEAGVFLNERTDVQNAQLPISFREGDDGPPSSSTRFLVRAVRLYELPARTARTVINSYHQFQSKEEP